jgi:hypothetical protein
MLYGILVGAVVVISCHHDAMAAFCFIQRSILLTPWAVFATSLPSIIIYRASSDFFSEKHPKNEKKVRRKAKKMKGLNGIVLIRYFVICFFWNNGTGIFQK